jgi:hypothetical protein
MNTFTDRQNPTLSRIMDEAYCEYIRRFCAARQIPWRDEYAEPLDGPPMGPIARARQDRALAKISQETRK